jgi:hypothetical protein
MPLRSSLRAHLGTSLLLVAGSAIAALGACGSVETGSTSTTTGTGGNGGGPTTSVTQSVAIGGCYDADGCGVPSDDHSTNGGCASCSILDACPTQSNACDENAECFALRKCVADCGLQSCIEGCSTQHPTGAELYRALLGCAYCACNLTSICTADREAAKPPIVCP